MHRRTLFWGLVALVGVASVPLVRSDAPAASRVRTGVRVTAPVAVAPASLRSAVTQPVAPLRSGQAPAGEATTTKDGAASPRPALRSDLAVPSLPVPASPVSPSKRRQPAPQPPLEIPPGCEGSTDRLVTVRTADGLRAALADARPGDRIVLADGTYVGRFKVTASGRPDRRIALCGTRATILDGGSIGYGYVLAIAASYWDVRGLRVTNGMKGIVLDRASYNQLEDVEVHSTGDEAVHFRSGSKNNRLATSVIHDTGQRDPRFGEGVYVGSAANNWCTYSNCNPDHSDNNVIEGNTISDTTAEPIDIKEGTAGGSVIGNRLDGSGSGAVAWVSVKGNGWRITGNHGRVSARDGFLVEPTMDGWGKHNVFDANTADVAGPGYGFRLLVKSVLLCDNVVTGAALGYSNTPCSAS